VLITALHRTGGLGHQPCILLLTPRIQAATVAASKGPRRMPSGERMLHTALAALPWPVSSLSRQTLCTDRHSDLDSIKNQQGVPAATMAVVWLAMRMVGKAAWMFRDMTT
jgi:hypothetical protein